MILQALIALEDVVTFIAFQRALLFIDIAYVTTQQIYAFMCRAGVDLWVVCDWESFTTKVTGVGLINCMVTAHMKAEFTKGYKNSTTELAWLKKLTLNLLGTDY